MATQLYLLRHGSTDVEPGTLVGSTDVGLNGKGLARLAEFGRQLEDVEVWYCSPMLRTRQTLDELRRHISIRQEISYDDRLREIDFGRWEMLSFAGISKLDPDLIDSWTRHTDFVFPGGEAVAGFCERVETMLQLFMAHDAEKIAVITHGGVIRTLICLALGISVRNYLLFEVQPASLTVFELFDKGGVLKGLNL
ncbi:MAG: histidine phosphatase family protein [Thermodesulfobacteriota bacterium]|nr:histidine phosphatase family protein [Thermodesulfobacteriota bacterium]